MGEMTRKMRKGLWSPDEDEKLSRCIAMYMNGSWSDIARKAGLERCGKSCRRRWMNHLRPDLKRGRFTPAEISRVVELHKALGNRWSEIAGHLVGRTDNDVKNLWNTQIKRRLKLQGLQSSAADADAHTKVESQDDEANSCHDGTGDGDGDGDGITHNMDHDDVEKMVAPSSSSSLKGFAPDQHHQAEYEDTVTCSLPSSSDGPIDVDGPLTPQTTLMSLIPTNLIKPNCKPASAFMFPFNSAPMFCADPQYEENLKNVAAMDHAATDPDTSAGMFASFPNASPPHINASNNPNAVFDKKSKSMRNQSILPHALSSSNLRKLEASRARAVYMDFPQLGEGENAMGIDFSINGERMEQQKCMQVGMVDYQWHRVSSDCGNAMIRMPCALQESAMPETLDGRYCGVPMYDQGASCSSTESSTSSTCSSAIDSRVSYTLNSQFGSPACAKQIRAAAAAVLTNIVPEGYSKENWNNILMYNTNDGEVQGTELLDGRSALVSGTSGSGSSDDYIGAWWSSLDVPTFELPNIGDPNCWQPLDINFI